MLPALARQLPRFISENATLPIDRIGIRTAAGRWRLAGLVMALLIAFQLSYVFALITDQGQLANIHSADVEQQSETVKPNYPFPVEKDPTRSNLSLLGVIHVYEYFKRDGGYIKRQIDKADVVALERGDGYFDALAAYALRTGKKVYYVDDFIAQSIGLYMPIIVLGIAFIEFMNFVSNRRRFALALLLTLYGQVILFPQPLYALLPDDFSPLGTSPNWIVEGRSITMLGHAEDLADRFKGSHVLWIAGAAHTTEASVLLQTPNELLRQQMITKAFWFFLPDRMPVKLELTDLVPTFDPLHLEANK